MKTKLIFAVTLMIPFIVLAESSTQCMNGNPATQLRCVQSRFEKSETELNNTFQKLISKVKGNDQLTSHIRQAENAWIYFRAGQCELVSFSQLNKIHLVAAQADCVTKLNIERTNLLKLLILNKFVTDDLCKNTSAEDAPICFKEVFDSSEKMMNDVYNQILKLLEEKQEYGNERNFILNNMASRLRISQRSWLHFRDSECDLLTYSTINSKTIISAQLACSAQMNNDRVDSLKQIFNIYLGKTIF